MKRQEEESAGSIFLLLGTYIGAMALLDVSLLGAVIFFLCGRFLAGFMK